MEAQQCAREPTGTNWPTLNNTQHNGPTTTANNAATTIQTTINPPPTQQWDTGEHTILWWSQHRGNAQPPFRTWKLSPAAPMVLQPTGCGRVGHRHNTRKTEGLTQSGEALRILCIAGTLFPAAVAMGLGWCCWRFVKRVCYLRKVRCLVWELVVVLRRSIVVMLRVWYWIQGLRSRLCPVIWGWVNRW